MPAPTSYYSSEDLEQAGPFIQNVLEEGTGTIELELICKDGRKILTEYRVSVINDELGEPKFIISIGRDITERKQAEEELQKLASVVHYSSELVNLAFLDGKMIFLNEAGSKMLGIDPKAVEKHIIMEVIPEHLVDLVTNELLPTLIKQGKWEGELQYRNIKTGGLTDVHAMCFTVKDPKTGTTKYLANVSLDITERKEAEKVIEKSYNRLQSLAQKVFTAQEEERQRISRELHDESGGMLTALNLKLDLISTELPPGQKTTRAQLADAKELVNQTMDGLRSLALGLRPLALDSFGLETTMEDLCRDFGKRTELHIDYHAAPIPDLSEIVQITLYRFLQEGLTNITKHGQANRVKVRFQHEAPVVILSVEDDGIGFDPATKGQGGMGLESMDERLELVGGHLEIHSQLGEGTRLTASVPIDEMTAEPE
jgi:PAS domain S-box-containing protein